MHGRHASEEDSRLIGIHVFVNPPQHALHRHPISLLVGHLRYVFVVVVEGSLSVGENEIDLLVARRKKYRVIVNADSILKLGPVLHQR